MKVKQFFFFNINPAIVFHSTHMVKTTIIIVSLTSTSKCGNYFVCAKVTYTGVIHILNILFMQTYLLEEIPCCWFDYYSAGILRRSDKRIRNSESVFQNYSMYITSVSNMKNTNLNGIREKLAFSRSSSQTGQVCGKLKQNTLGPQCWKHTMPGSIFITLFMFPFIRNLY